MSIATNKRLIERYYAELWNAKKIALAEKILDPNLTFRGSLGNTVSGIEGFKTYMQIVHLAFPDFTNTVEELIAEKNTVVARLTYGGTNRGELFGRKGTGRKVTYRGIAIFQIKKGKIVSGYVIGDRTGLQEQLRAQPAKKARR
ncbi:MAG TPA: ester cyclase [Planctomycetota bacterium]|nr:ester cyclase [Planctomycetota bacterium]